MKDAEIGQAKRGHFALCLVAETRCRATAVGGHCPRDDSARISGLSSNGYSGLHCRRGLIRASLQESHEAAQQYHKDYCANDRPLHMTVPRVVAAPRADNADALQFRMVRRHELEVVARIV